MHAYFQHTLVNPLTLWAYSYTFSILKDLQLLENAKFLKNLFRTLLMVLNWSKNNYLFGPSSQKKCANIFYPKTLSIWGQLRMRWLKNIHFEPPHNISSIGKKTSLQKSHAWAHLSCLLSLCYNFTHNPLTNNTVESSIWRRELFIYLQVEKYHARLEEPAEMQHALERGRGHVGLAPPTHHHHH